MFEESEGFVLYLNPHYITDVCTFVVCLNWAAAERTMLERLFKNNNTLLSGLLETGPQEGVVAVEVGVEEEDGVWAVEMALIPVANETLTDTAAVTNRELFQ